ncbi:MAG: four helix bundle protein [bacterium]
MQMHDYEKLVVWQKSMDFVIFVYEITKKFPKNEDYALTSQIRRAVISVPSNIAEGSRRNTQKDFAHFLTMSLGSLAELDTQIKIAERLKYVSKKEEIELYEKLSEIMRMLNKLIERNR